MERHCHNYSHEKNSTSENNPTGTILRDIRHIVSDYLLHRMGPSMSVIDCLGVCPAVFFPGA